ncbi:MAG: hypothetical protein WBA74_20500, partial [Cyclobacteriaceae bacterium]
MTTSLVSIENVRSYLNEKESELNEEFLSSSGLDTYIRSLYNRDISIQNRSLFTFLVNQRAKQLFEAATVSGSTLQTSFNIQAGDNLDIILPDGQQITLDINNSPSTNTSVIFNLVDEQNNSIIDNTFNPLRFIDGGLFGDIEN